MLQNIQHIIMESNLYLKLSSEWLRISQDQITSIYSFLRVNLVLDLLEVRIMHQQDTYSLISIKSQDLYSLKLMIIYLSIRKMMDISLNQNTMYQSYLCHCVMELKELVLVGLPIFLIIILVIL